MKQLLVFCLTGVLLMNTGLFGQGITPEVQAKLADQLKALQAWGSDAKFVNAVKAYNSTPSPEAKAMTNEKWSTLSLLDPFVRSLTKNELGEHLKTLKSDIVSEIFVSGADGGKVAYLAKTSSWSHAGKAKHDNPMSGKTWQGPLELDASSGVQQIQLSFPVVDGGKPIGSVVVGLNVSKLK